MVVLTSNRFVGDTVYQFVLRVGGTFIGAAGGLVVWYIGNGDGANAYGTAAVCAVVVSALPSLQPLPRSGLSRPL